MHPYCTPNSCCNFRLRHSSSARAWANEGLHSTVAFYLCMLRRKYSDVSNRWYAPVLPARTSNGDVCEKISDTGSCLFLSFLVTLVKASENQPNGFVKCSVSLNQGRFRRARPTVYNELFGCCFGIVRTRIKEYLRSMGYRRTVQHRRNLKLFHVRAVSSNY